MEALTLEDIHTVSDVCVLDLDDLKGILKLGPAKKISLAIGALAAEGQPPLLISCPSSRASSPPLPLPPPSPRPPPSPCQHSPHRGLLPPSRQPTHSSRSRPRRQPPSPPPHSGTPRSWAWPSQLSARASAGRAPLWRSTRCRRRRPWPSPRAGGRSGRGRRPVVLPPARSAVYRLPRSGISRTTRRRALSRPRCPPPAIARIAAAAAEYSALIPLLQRQVLCVDTTASTPSTLR